MSITDLIAMLRNRLAYNEQQRVAAMQRGDIHFVGALDADTAASTATLLALEAALAAAG